MPRKVSRLNVHQEQVLFLTGLLKSDFERVSAFIFSDMRLLT